MAKSYFPSLTDLEDYFGSSAKLEYADIPVEKNNIEFSAELENGSVWFKLIGSQNCGELRLVAKPFSVVKLVLTDISKVSVRKTQEDHYIQIHFANTNTDNLQLWLRPKVLLFWGNEGAVDEDQKHHVRQISGIEDDA